MILAELSSATAFRTGSGLHFACLLGGASLTAIFAMAGHRAVRRGDAAAKRRLRTLAGYGCLVAWLVNTAFGFHPRVFSWDRSLPLHFCNLANLIGAAAVLGSSRL